MCDGAPDCDNAADEEFTLCNPEGRLLLILELKITIIYWPHRGAGDHRDEGGGTWTTKI